MELNDTALTLINNMLLPFAPAMDHTRIQALVRECNDGKMPDPETILPADTPMLLTIQETADILRLHRNTVSKMIAAGKLRPVRYSTGYHGKTLIRRSEVDRLIQTKLQEEKG